MGKPTAPVQGVKGYTHEFGYYEGVEGLTIRQYFMARAPAEPQAWFKPEMRPRPTMPDKYETLNVAQGKEWEAMQAGCDVDDGDVIDFARSWDAAKLACEAYDAEYVRQKYAQWPAAWADAVLAAGEK